MIGTTYPVAILPPDDGENSLLAVAGELRERDIVFGNLEGPMVDEGPCYKCPDDRLNGSCFAFRMPTRYVKYLTENGFNALNIANNHALDFGTKGLTSTLRTLGTAGIKAVGGGKTANFFNKGRRIVIVGFSFGYTSQHASVNDIESAALIVRKLKEENHIVIVSFHGGAEGGGAQHISDATEMFAGEKRGNVVRFSRAVIDAGADMVLGHGPHVLRAMEIYREKLIVYSLGNFFTYGLFNIKGPSGISMILHADIDMDTGNLMSGKIVPLKLRNRGIPYPDPAGDAIRLVQSLSEHDIDHSNIVIEDSGYFYPKTSELRPFLEIREHKEEGCDKYPDFIDEMIDKILPLAPNSIPRQYDRGIHAPRAY